MLREVTVRASYSHATDDTVVNAGGGMVYHHGADAGASTTTLQAWEVVLYHHTIHSLQCVGQ